MIKSTVPFTNATDPLNGLAPYVPSLLSQAYVTAVNAKSEKINIIYIIDMFKQWNLYL